MDGQVVKADDQVDSQVVLVDDQEVEDKMQFESF